MACKHCRNGFLENKFGQDVECVNGVLIDIDVAHEGWQHDVDYPVAPCHPMWSRQQARDEDFPNDSQERLSAWSDPTPAPRTGGLEDRDIDTLQARVEPWMMACFGAEIAADKLERGDRLLEEVIELLQATDYPRERISALEDYVYSRPQGEINQEVGGVMITLAAHCLAHGVDMHEAGETELARIWTKVEAIRAKQAAKPTGSALPIATEGK